MRRPALRALGLLVSVASLAGCELLTAPNDFHELDLAREQWAIHGSAVYSYQVRRSCFCDHPLVGHWVEVVVDHGLVVEAYLVATGEPLHPSTLSSFPIVEDLFDLAEDALHDADGYRIRYDSFRGYPRLLDIDWVRNAVDDELEIRAEGFIPLQ